MDADIVPRLSIQSFEDLRHEVLEVLCRIKVPKHQVILYRRKKGLKDREALVDANARTLFKKEDIPATRFHRQVQQFLEYQSTSAKEQRTQKELYVAELYAPGKIIHLFRTEEKAKFMQGMQASERSQRPPRHSVAFNSFGASSSRETESDLLDSNSSAANVGSTSSTAGGMYTARWAEKEDLRTLILSKHSLTDHNPIFLKQELRRMAERAGLQPPYSNVLSETID